MSDSAEPKGKDEKKVGDEMPPPAKAEEVKTKDRQRFQKGTEVQK